MKRFLQILVIGCLVVMGVFGVNFLIFLNTPYGHPASFIIEPGMNFGQVIDLLTDQDLIANHPLFKLYGISQRLGRKVRAGQYDFAGAVTPRELMATLIKGDFAKLRITIPEGWTAREIADSLGKSGMVDPLLFMQKVTDPEFIRSLGLSANTLEGYLFPDTYEIYKPKGPEEVLQRMVGHFKEVWEREFGTRAQESGLLDYEVIILASIVEKETGSEAERPVVASVFLNRLAYKMALASDPTVIYGIRNFSGNLTRADLERPGPYNSYLNPGLPPTPIANPGRESLRAVLYPAATEYLYFVSRNDGTHEFSKTVEEHSRAVGRYQHSQIAGQSIKFPTTEATPR